MANWLVHNTKCLGCGPLIIISSTSRYVAPMITGGCYFYICICANIKRAANHTVVLVFIMPYAVADATHVQVWLLATAMMFQYNMTACTISITHASHIASVNFDKYTVYWIHPFVNE